MSIEENARPQVLVLGGTGYVGSAVVKALSAEGAHVHFTYCSREAEAHAQAAGLGAHALRLDVREPARIDALPGQLPELDAVVQCIGTAGDGGLYEHTDAFAKFEAIDAEGWSTMQQLTVDSSFRLFQRLAPRLRNPSNLVVVGSVDGVKSVPAPVHYAAAKAALSGMVRALAKALGPRGVCVNMVAAGILEGGIGRLLSEPLRQQYIKHCAMRRLGRADEVAQLCAWLALENRYLSGQSVTLDGGL